jgi:hypothetical protein
MLCGPPNGLTNEVVGDGDAEHVHNHKAPMFFRDEHWAWEITPPCGEFTGPRDNSNFHWVVSSAQADIAKNPLGRQFAAGVSSGMTLFSLGGVLSLTRTTTLFDWPVPCGLHL